MRVFTTQAPLYNNDFPRSGVDCWRVGNKKKEGKLHFWPPLRLAYKPQTEPGLHTASVVRAASKTRPGQTRHTTSQPNTPEQNTPHAQPPRGLPPPPGFSPVILRKQLAFCTLFESASQTYTYTPSVAGLEQPPSAAAAAPSLRAPPPPPPPRPPWAAERGSEPLALSVSVSSRAEKEAVQVLGLGRVTWPRHNQRNGRISDGIDIQQPTKKQPRERQRCFFACHACSNNGVHDAARACMQQIEAARASPRTTPTQQSNQN